MKIAPSMLACDFCNLSGEMARLNDSGADLIHLDIMDGNFVKNISFGPDIVKSLRPLTKLPFDVHLMINNPIEYIDRFALAGADIISFHVEALSDIGETIKKIKSRNIKAGLVIKPNTKINEIFKYINDIDMVLIMTVEPGFGGQAFMGDMMPKITQIKEFAKSNNKDILVEVDGGINLKTIKTAAKFGADIAVAGTSVFKSSNLRLAIDELKIAANEQSI